MWLVWDKKTNQNQIPSLRCVCQAGPEKSLTSEIWETLWLQTRQASAWLFQFVLYYSGKTPTNTSSGRKGFMVYRLQTTIQGRQDRNWSRLGKKADSRFPWLPQLPFLYSQDLALGWHHPQLGGWDLPHLLTIKKCPHRHTHPQADLRDAIPWLRVPLPRNI